MKKIIVLLIMVFVLLGAMSVMAEDVSVIVNGEEIVFDQKVVVDNDTPMIPLRFVAEKIGANISWYGETRTVFAEFEGVMTTIQIGNELLFYNEEAIKLEKAPALFGDRTLVPMSVIEITTGADVLWDKENSKIVITK